VFSGGTRHGALHTGIASDAASRAARDLPLLLPLPAVGPERRAAAAAAAAAAVVRGWSRLGIHRPGGRSQSSQQPFRPRNGHFVI
jgi:hypothetical protein